VEIAPAPKFPAQALRNSSPQNIHFRNWRRSCLSLAAASFGRKNVPNKDQKLAPPFRVTAVETWLVEPSVSISGAFRIRPRSFSSEAVNPWALGLS